MYFLKSFFSSIGIFDSETYNLYNEAGGYPAQCKPRKGGHDSAQSKGILTLLIFREGGINVDMDAIVSLFSNLAVPVACLIATFYLWNKEREDHKQEQKELTEAIANNTLVMQKLVDKLDKDVS